MVYEVYPKRTTQWFVYDISSIISHVGSKEDKAYVNFTPTLEVENHTMVCFISIST